MCGESKKNVSLCISKHHLPINAATHDLIERLDTAKNEADVKKILYKDDNCDVYWQIINNCRWPMSEVINGKNKHHLIQEIVYSELVSSRKEEIEEI